MPEIQVMTVASTERPVSLDTRQAVKLKGIQGMFSNYMKQSQAGGSQLQGSDGLIATGNQGKDQTVAQQNYEIYQSKAGASADKVGKAQDATGQEIDSETVQGAVDAVKEVIKEELGVDEEQLEQAMEVLGLAGIDLLDPQNLMLLTMNLTDTQDMGMMLLNGNFQTILQDVAVISQDLLEELGMSMEDLVSQIQLQTEQQVDTGFVEALDEQLLAPVENTDSAQAGTEELLQNQQVQSQQLVTEEPQKADAPRMEAEAAPVPQSVPVTEENVAKAEAEPEDGPKQESVTSNVQEAKEEDNSKQAFEDSTDQQMEDGTRQERGAQQTEFHASIHSGTVQNHSEVPMFAEPQTNTNAPMPQIDVQSVIEQIVEYSRTTLTENVKTIEMQLNPENLGKILLHVTQKDGVVTAQLTAQNESMKEALAQQAVVLRDNLNQQGIKVEAVEVSVGTHEFEENLEKDAKQQEEQSRQEEERTSRNRRRNIDLNDLDDLSGLMSEEEALVAQIMRDNGNNVDYKA